MALLVIMSESLGYEKIGASLENSVLLAIAITLAHREPMATFLNQDRKRPAESGASSGESEGA